jgi:phosphoribosylanthranilate isomerase
MIDGVRLKFCGLRTLVDAEFADKLGADYLGFILYPQSPRYLSLRDYGHMAPNLPTGRRRVAVVVSPSAAEIAAILEADFDRVQIHFPATTSPEQVEAWAAQIGKDRLWLVPKRAPETAYQAAWLAAAHTHLVDTFHATGFGGSGQPGNWPEFAALQARHPDHRWILAGGLNPANIGAALRESGARGVDVNSGVETAPGIKDHEKMKALVLAIHRERTPQSADGHE